MFMMILCMTHNMSMYYPEQLRDNTIKFTLAADSQHASINRAMIVIFMENYLLPCIASRNRFAIIDRSVALMLLITHIPQPVIVYLEMRNNDCDGVQLARISVRAETIVHAGKFEYKICNEYKITGVDIDCDSMSVCYGLTRRFSYTIEGSSHSYNITVGKFLYKYGHAK